MGRSIVLLAIIVAGLVAAGAGPVTRPENKDGPATAPATKPAPLDLGRVLHELPKDAKPTKAGWDEFTEPAAKRWLTKRLVGSIVLVTARIDTVTVERIPKKEDPDQTAGWRVTTKLLPTAIRGMPMPVSQSLIARGDKPNPGEEPDSLSVVTTEDEAKALKGLKGGTLTLRGKIVDVKIDTDPDSPAESARRVIVILSECVREVPPPKAR